MTERPSPGVLAATLAAAGVAHHDYEQTVLGGVRDELWPGFYAAFVLGRLGDFMAPGRLARLLAEVQASDGWPEAAARHVLDAAAGDPGD